MTYDPSRWTTATQIQTALQQPPFIIFMNTYTGVGVTTPFNGLTYTRGGWTTVDVSDYVPADTKAIFLQGIMIISHGSVAETADFHVNFRPPSSTEAAGNYEGQVIETQIAGGQRSPFATWVSVENGKFQFYWNVPQLGTWPAYSSYGLNLVMPAFVR